MPMDCERIKLTDLPFLNSKNKVVQCPFDLLHINFKFGENNLFTSENGKTKDNYH